ncbi:MAG: SH3 domain-containing protein [Candidatus Electrothrix sp. YB6]
MKKTSLINLLLFTFLLTLHVQTALAIQMVAVDNDNVNMRSGPGLNEKVLWKLSQGFPLKVLKTSGKWLHVQDFEGSKGWVHKNVVNRSGHMIVRAQKDGGKINIRSKPDTRSKVVAQAYYGVVFKTLQQRKGWVKVRHDNVTGWIKRTLLWGF